jgi:hypothetical protein
VFPLYKTGNAELLDCTFVVDDGKNMTLEEAMALFQAR